MKWYLRLAAVFSSLLLLFSLCPLALASDGETVILLSDDGITVDGEAVSTDSSAAVYTGAEIVYYKEGQDSSYGAGSASDGHSAAEAAMHTVVTITAAGTYRISGSLSYGQIAVDVGTDADDVVELILDGVSINCTVAPGIIFYNVYNEEDADKVSAGEAGAILTLAEGSVNTVAGSHVAKIYKTGTTKKLHKYDGAVYSKMSMVVQGSGSLNIIADNEGLDAELHMAINGGNISIASQDDGVNVNEDGVSKFIMNDGYLFISAGLGSEGDGVDSNGYMVINGGTILAFAHNGADGGIDSDSEIIINGGTVMAFGARNDAVSKSESTQPYMELFYASTKSKGTIVSIFDKATEKPLLVISPLRDFQSFTYSSASLSAGSTYYVLSGGTATGSSTNGVYSLSSLSYSGGMQQMYTSNSSGGGMPGGGMPGGGMQSGSNDFTLGNSYTFSGVTNARTVTFTGSVEVSAAELFFTASISNYTTESAELPFSYTGAFLEDDSAVSDLDPETVQFTVSDVPSESYFASATLADGLEAIEALFPDTVGSYSLTISVTDANTAYFGSAYYLFNVTDGTLTVTLWGDANCDGSVGSDDAACILRATVLIASLSEQGTLNGDVTHDGKVSADDAAKILRYTVKLEPDLGI